MVTDTAVIEVKKNHVHHVRHVHHAFLSAHSTPGIGNRGKGLLETPHWRLPRAWELCEQMGKRYRPIQPWASQLLLFLATPGSLQSGFWFKVHFSRLSLVLSFWDCYGNVIARYRKADSVLFSLLFFIQHNAPEGHPRCFVYQYSHVISVSLKKICFWRPNPKLARAKHIIYHLVIPPVLVILPSSNTEPFSCL